MCASFVRAIFSGAELGSYQQTTTTTTTSTAYECIRGTLVRGVGKAADVMFRRWPLLFADFFSRFVYLILQFCVLCLLTVALVHLLCVLSLHAHSACADFILSWANERAPSEESCTNVCVQHVL